MDDAHVLRELGKWYSGNPHVRRACAFPDEGVLHVFLDVEPVMDSDEVLPIWLAYSQIWESQLTAATGCIVSLGYLEQEEFTAPAGPHSGLEPFMLETWQREYWEGR